MAARKKGPARPVNAALKRLLELTTKNVPPARMGREVEIIVAGWNDAPEADPVQVKEWIEEILETLQTGVADAEEQVSDIDRSDAGAIKQANGTLAALTATRDAALRVLASL
ncbi:hypothetical protein [Roseococcus sp.]|uniref:hypothetical protein n=1 Tax=Roseococcus sp. TaxID=2109646 RepID=UPI003BA85F7A